MFYDEENVFAKILKKDIPTEIILENKYSIAFKDIVPRAPKHFLIIPKGKYIKYDDFLNNASKDEIYYLFSLINELVIKFELQDTGYRIITNAGKDANQEVPHLHFHLLAGRNLGPM